MTATETKPLSELILHWDEQFRVGIPRIDEQHQRLLRLAAFVAAAVAEKHNAEIVKALLFDVASFAEEHFSSEERLMEQLEYPELEAHREEHDDFRARIGAFLHECADDETLGIRVMQVMQAWLKRHLMECDRRYAEYFEERAIQVIAATKKSGE